MNWARKDCFEKRDRLCDPCLNKVSQALLLYVIKTCHYILEAEKSLGFFSYALLDFLISA